MITYKAKNAAGEIINSALSPFTFPAGEAHIKREDRRELEPIEIAIIQPDAASIHNDLFHLAMWRDYINRDLRTRSSGEDTRKVLLLPYIPGARADRGAPFGLDVYAEFIDNLALNQVIVFDPHSEVAVDFLDPTVLRPHDILAKSSSYAGIIAPDKGAVARAQGVADKFGVPLYTAEKSRNFETGKLTGYVLDMPESGEKEHFLVVDDICDGGGTFVLLSEAFAAVRPRAYLDLYVSHGVFSGDAVYNLSTSYDGVMTTNSYNPHGESITCNFQRLDVIRPMLKAINV